MATSSSDDGFEIIEDHQIPLRPANAGTTAVTENLTQEPILTIHSIPNKDSMIVSIQPPLKPENDVPHVPCDIVLVIDISGSMNSSAPIPTGERGGEDTGLSILDLTKHAARTIIETLNENDRLAVVTFCTEVKVAFELDFMNKENKSMVLRAINKLYGTSSTNLWHGIKEGLKVLTATPVRENVQSLLVLTDGAPNHMCPAQGYVPKLRQTLLDHRNSTGSLPLIHTFGFGYYLRSPLLQSIAEIGGGIFAFIPDAGMIGTVFVHAVANLFSTFTPQAKLILQGDSSSELRVDLGSKPGLELEKSTGNGISLRLGSLRYGQSRDIIIHYGKSSKSRTVNMQGKLVYTAGGETREIEVQKMAHIDEISVSQAVCDYHLMRSRLCTLLRTFHPLEDTAENFNFPTTDIEDIRTKLESLATEIKGLSQSDEYNLSLFEDIAGESPHGQISMALSSTEFYGRWGQHYLLSILNAHVNQLCNSFKDSGPLMYGKDSPLFNKCRTELDEVFDNLPPPKPSRSVPTLPPGVSRPAMRMSHYNRSSGPCFTGSCRVRLAGSGSERVSPTIPIEYLRPPVSVWTPQGPRKVRAVLQSIVKDVEICEIDCLQITPWHPMKFQGKWEYPINMTNGDAQAFSGNIYSVLLEPDSNPDAHAIMVEDHICVTLGHGILQGDIRAHELFGNYQLVIKQLELLPKLPNGLLHCVGVERSPESGRICGLIGYNHLLKAEPKCQVDGSYTGSIRVTSI
ncbi:U-box domain-containing protein [Nannizzia gypsea CBS 118893]|uniref:U-box domain-containing protein n=1 Tax=Arthroderma gypseum (strain ATCC MYA-4604 / CBS 118893) TaxID=535722 RepID=E4UR10_ARTGP|nr:U-box domain-containing protein [Nannizzia gypsea CBS 118893]EFR00125.1 U-box domain-containing protein [Nannizzia gypsea CBS 118893]